jgi:hypothetical protein
MTTDEDNYRIKRRQNHHIITTPVKCREFSSALRCDSGSAPLPMGNGRAMIGKSNWQFSENDFEVFYSNPGSIT